MSEEKPTGLLSISPINAVLVLATALVLGVLIATILLHGLPSQPSIPSLPSIVPSAPVAAKPVVREWMKAPDPRWQLGLRDDGVVVWTQARRIGDAGDLPPAGQGPIGKAP